MRKGNLNAIRALAANQSNVLADSSFTSSLQGRSSVLMKFYFVNLLVSDDAYMCACREFHTLTFHIFQTLSKLVKHAFSFLLLLELLIF